MYECWIKFLPWYWQDSITVWGQFSLLLSFAYVMHHCTSTVSESKHVLHSKPIRMQTLSMSLPRNKTNLLSSPKGPVLLIWCSSRTDPNIMHFPSLENLHTAQQTDKYLIGQPSVPPPPPPHGSSYSGHESTQEASAMSVFGDQSPCGDKVCPAYLWTPLRLVLAAPVCLATSTPQMPGHNRWINTKTRNNNKGLLPFPDKTKQPLQGGGCRVVYYSEMLNTSL